MFQLEPAIPAVRRTLAVGWLLLSAVLEAREGRPHLLLVPSVAGLAGLVDWRIFRVAGSDGGIGNVRGSGGVGTRTLSSFGGAFATGCIASLVRSSRAAAVPDDFTAVVAAGHRSALAILLEQEASVRLAFAS